MDLEFTLNQVQMLYSVQYMYTQEIPCYTEVNRNAGDSTSEERNHMPRKSINSDYKIKRGKPIILTF